MEKKTSNEAVCNRFVKQLVDVIELAATYVLLHMSEKVYKQIEHFVNYTGDVDMCRLTSRK